MKEKRIKTGRRKFLTVILTLALCFSFAAAGTAAFADDSNEEAVGGYLDENDTGEAEQDKTVTDDDWKDDPSDDSENLPTPVITKATSGTRSITIRWKGKGTSYEVVLYKKGGKKVITSVDSMKGTTKTFKGLNPGQTYTVGVTAYTEDEASDEAKRNVKVVNKHSYTIYKTNKQAENAIYKGIKNKKKTIKFLMKKKNSKSAGYLLFGALPEKKLGDYMLSNLKYYSAEKEATNERNEAIVINGVKYAAYTYRFSYFTTKKQDRVFEKKLTKTVKKLGLNKKKTTKQKIRIIANYLDRNTKQNTKNRYRKTAYGALMKGQCTCKGRSALFYRMAKKTGIKTRIIEGDMHGKDRKEKTDTDRNHFSTIVKTGGKWYQFNVQNRDKLYGKKSIKADYTLIGRMKPVKNIFRFAPKNAKIPKLTAIPLP